MSAFAVAIYTGVGFFLVSATHSYYCLQFHSGSKRFGPPFVEWGPNLDYRTGYVGAALLGVLAGSLTLNYLTYAFENFPTSVTAVRPMWFAGLLVLYAFLLFVASPALGGPAASKWVLEGSLFFLVFLLILSIPADETTFDQVQFVFSVTGAVLASIYLAWLKLYILHNESVEPATLREALDTVETRTDGVWVLWGTVVYFVFSGVYLLIGYLFVFVVLN